MIVPFIILLLFILAIIAVITFMSPGPLAAGLVILFFLWGIGGFVREAAEHG